MGGFQLLGRDQVGPLDPLDRQLPFVLIGVHFPGHPGELAGFKERIQLFEGLVPDFSPQTPGSIGQDDIQIILAAPGAAPLFFLTKKY